MLYSDLFHLSYKGKANCITVNQSDDQISPEWKQSRQKESLNKLTLFRWSCM